MKNLNYFFFLLLFGSSIAVNAQNVNIPDANFKAELVANAAINTNGDGEIQVIEAQAFSGSIIVPNKSIASLVGIEAFTALTTLVCNDNPLMTLNVSSNTALTILVCQYNQLSTLDVSSNTALTTLHCYSNSLTALDVSANTALTTLWCRLNQLTTLNVNNTSLTYLDCSFNQLTALDVSANTALNYLYCNSNQIAMLNINNNVGLIQLQCYNNQLTTLDVSANTALVSLGCGENQINTLDCSLNTALNTLYCSWSQLTTLNVKNGNNINMADINFQAEGNPNLTCIEVDDVTYSTTTWTTYIDSIASFSTNCLLNTTTLAGETMNITTYPNPTTSNINISLGKNYQTAVVELRNIMGQTVSSKEYNGVNQIDMNIEGAAGVYFVNIRTEEGEVVVKVVKE